MPANIIESRSIFEPYEFANLNQKKLWQLLTKGLAEMCGTAILLSIGCMSVLPSATGAPQSHLNVIFSFSFAIATSIIIFGHISGSHINPALSIADVVRGQKSIFMFLYYTVMQCFGAFVGYSILRAIVPNEIFGEGGSSFCCNAVDPRLSPWQAFEVEMLITGILSFVFCAVQDSKNPDAGLTVAIKFGLACVALLTPSAYFAGSSMNPARTFGPALFNRNWTNHWVYWFGPMSGSMIAAYVYTKIFAEHHPPGSKSRSVSRQNSTRSARVTVRPKELQHLGNGDEV